MSGSRVRPEKRTSKALVIDDDQLQCEFIADMLRGLGIGSVSTANRGEEALRLMRSSQAGARYDLMLCDLHMPEMDGFQLLSAAAQSGYMGALIIVSGQSPEALRSASLVAQLQRFNVLGTLPKPVQKDALKNMLAQLY